MIQYATISVEFPNSELEVVGEYADNDTNIEFQIRLLFERQSVIYKTWRRSKWNRYIEVNFDEMMQDPMAPNPVKIADKFRKMGEDIFKTRFKTLLFEAGNAK